MLVDQNDPTDHTAIILKMGVPVGVAEHDIGSAVRAMLVGAVEDAAEIRPNAPCFEVVPDGFVEPDARWTCALVQPCRAYVVGHQISKAAVSIAQIEIVGIRFGRGNVRAPDRVEALLPR